MIRAVFFDIDGTLLSHSTNSVPEKTMRALHALREQGIKVIICTGRHAMEMEELGIDIDTALSIEVEDDVIVRRMSGRRTCPSCGSTFHVVNNPPKVEGVCDNCGAALTIRKDDAPETVKARLVTYHHETEPLKAFYESRGKLVTVDNRPTIEATTEAIRAALEI